MINSCIYSPLSNFDKRIKILKREQNSINLILENNFIDLKEVWACVETTNKSTEFFDGVNLSKSYSLIVKIMYNNIYELNINIENWIKYNNNIYKIIDIENINEKNEYIIIKCIKKGDETINANRT